MHGSSSVRLSALLFSPVLHWCTAVFLLALLRSASSSFWGRRVSGHGLLVESCLVCGKLETLSELPVAQTCPPCRKNRVVDYFLQTVAMEREYMQLHRDTTVSQLTAARLIMSEERPRTYENRSRPTPATKSSFTSCSVSTDPGHACRLGRPPVP